MITMEMGNYLHCIYLVVKWRDFMKILSIEESREVKAGVAHYHWTCLDFGIGKKRYVSKPYYYNVFQRTGRDIEKHNSKYGHQWFTRMRLCYKNCK